MRYPCQSQMKLLWLKPVQTFSSHIILLVWVVNYYFFISTSVSLKSAIWVVNYLYAKCETQQSPKPKLKESKKNTYNKKLEEILNIYRKLNWQNIKMISWRLREYLEKLKSNSTEIYHTGFNELKRAQVNWFQVNEDILKTIFA